MRENKHINPNKEKELTVLRKTNPNLVKLMRENIDWIEPSPECEEKMLNLAHKHKEKLAKEENLNNSDWLRWLQPIITPIRDLRKLFGLDGFLVDNLRVAGATLVIVSLIGGLSYLMYYQYKNTRYTNQGLIVDHQIPATSTTSTPVPTPIPSPEVTPALNTANDNSNKLNTNSGNENNHITKNQKQPNKTEKPKSNPLNGTIDDNQVAHNTKPKDFITEDTSNSTREIEKVKKGVTLSEVKTIYIASFGDEEKDKDLRNAIISKFSSDSRFKLLKPIDMVKNKADAVLKKKDSFLRLTDGVNGKILWEKELKDSMSSFFEESAREIFDELTRESH